MASRSWKDRFDGVVGLLGRSASQMADELMPGFTDAMTHPKSVGQVVEGLLPQDPKDVVGDAITQWRGGDRLGAVEGLLGGIPQTGMFLGRNAKMADHAKLAEAEKMQASGAPREAIWDSTGWFQGVDGKWRFEIPDDAANVTPWTRETHSMASVPFMQKQGKQATAMPVDKYLDHPELARNYWPLREDGPGVYFEQFEGGTRGQYNPKYDTVSIGVPYDESRSTALHELQHVVQQREDFARGGNTSDLSINPIETPEFVRWRSNLNDPDLIELQNLSKSDATLKEQSAANRLYRDKYDPLIASIAQEQMALGRRLTPEERASFKERRDAIFKEFEAEQAKLFPTIGKLEQLARALHARGITISPPTQQFLDPYDAYHRLAGEVEARTTQKRENMTASERKARAPWLDYDVPEDKQIVRGLLGR